MIQVMIVDDEPIIRMGLHKVINWDSLGCVVIAVAENGEEALRMFEKGKPDLVISDIKMPKMDGLELAEKLYEMSSQIKVILLTGYKEFEYARRAVEYGVCDYILKPVDHDELEGAIKRVVNQIQTQQEETFEKSLLKEKMQTSIPILKDKFITDLLFRSPDNIYHIYEKLEYFDIKLGEFILIAVNIDSFYDLEEKFSEDDVYILTFLIIEQLERLQEEYQLSVLPFIRNKTVYGIMGEIKEIQKDQIISYAEILSERIFKLGKFTVSIGISNSYNGPFYLKKARLEVEQCILMSHYLGADNVVSIHDIDKNRNINHQEEEITLEYYFMAIKNGIGVREEMDKIIKRLYSYRDSIKSRSIIMELVGSGFRIYGERYGETAELVTDYHLILEKIHASQNMLSLISLIKEHGEAIAGMIEEKVVSRTKYIMEQAVAYMKENAEKEVSLEEVADYVYVSKWYFSKIFKKEMGINFSDFMANLRIEEAKRLIRENPTLKNYEVAEMTGFGNVRYFSQLFKKVTGKTPSEFRT